MRSAVVVGFRRCRCGRLVAGYRPVDAVGARDSDDFNFILAGLLVGDLVDADALGGALCFAFLT